MLDSVLLARDRYLRAGGAILPDVARIFIAAANEAATGIDFWRDVYGLNMGVVADSLRQSALEQGIVRVVNPASVLTEGQLIKTLDLATMAATDQDFSSDFELPAGASPGVCHALVLWFDTLFTQRFCKEAPQELPTGPHTTPTHWAQTVLPLPAPVRLARADAGVHGAAIALKGRVSLARRGGRHRTLDISVEYSPMGVDGNVGESKVQLYSMGVSNGGPA